MKYLIPLLLLSACAATDVTRVAESPVPKGIDDTCRAASVDGLIGQDATALERVLLLVPMRMIRPGIVVTQDYNPERINFHINAENTLRRISCG